MELTNLIYPYKDRIAQFCLWLTCAVFILSCSDNEVKENKQVIEVDPAFREFLAKFPLRSYPISIRGCNINVDDLPSLTGQRFISGQASYHAYGLVHSSDDFICLIILAGADCEIPMILTFDSIGNKIDERAINIGYCGSDCGYVCNEIMQLNANDEIFTADTVSLSKCDSLGNPVPGTNEYYTIYKTGKVLKNGKIQLSQETRKEL